MDQTSETQLSPAYMYGDPAELMKDFQAPFRPLPPFVSPPPLSRSLQSPLASGFLDYFPDAAAAVAECSKIGNDQHNPGQKLHWAREKSTEHADKLMGHFVRRGTIDSDGVRHSTKTAWRAMAFLQEEIEAARDNRGLETVLD